MKELLNTYLDANVINNEQVLEKSEDLSRNPTIPTSKLLKFKILLDQIDRNRYRVHTTLSHPATTRDVEHWKNTQEIQEIVDVDNSEDGTNTIKDNTINQELKCLSTYLIGFKVKTGDVT